MTFTTKSSSLKPYVLEQRQLAPGAILGALKNKGYPEVTSELSMSFITPSKDLKRHEYRFQPGHNNA